MLQLMVWLCLTNLHSYTLQNSHILFWWERAQSLSRIYTQSTDSAECCEVVWFWESVRQTFKHFQISSIGLFVWLERFIVHPSDKLFVCGTPFRVLLYAATCDIEPEKMEEHIQNTVRACIKFNLPWQRSWRQSIRWLTHDDLHVWHASVTNEWWSLPMTKKALFLIHV